VWKDFFCSGTYCIGLNAVYTFNFVVDLRYGRLSVHSAQQRCLDVSDLVFEQIAVGLHEDIASTGGQLHWSFCINLFVFVCTRVPVVLHQLEAEHRRQIDAEVHPYACEGVLGKVNFDASVTISVPNLNDGSLLWIISRCCLHIVGPLYFAYHRVYGIVGSVAQHKHHGGT